jgi:hypothetical protein
MEFAMLVGDAGKRLSANALSAQEQDVVRVVMAQGDWEENQDDSVCMLRSAAWFTSSSVANVRSAMSLAMESVRPVMALGIH